VPEAIQMGSAVVSSRVGPTGSYGQPPWLFRGLHCGKDFCRSSWEAVGVMGGSAVGASNGGYTGYRWGRESAPMARHDRACRHPTDQVRVILMICPFR
jgi:hypothetical protein